MASTDNVSMTALGYGPPLDAHHILQNDPSMSQRKVSASSTDTNNATMRKNKDFVSRPKANSSSSRNTQESSNIRVENRIAQRDVRTLPPWIDSYEEGEPVLNSKATDRLLSSPNRTHAAQHHYAPASPTRRMSQDGFVDEFDDVSAGVLQEKHETNFFGAHKEPERGRKWDHVREGDPVIMQSELLQNGSPWRTYIKSSMYGPAQEEDGKRVDESFLAEQTPGYQKPWRGDLEGSNDSEKLTGLLQNKRRQRSIINRFQHTLLMHPLVPLVFRVTVLITSVIALGLAASVHHLSNKHFGDYQNPSTTMAIIVDVIAIPYILYITWDEYTGKPLGLRSPKAKIRLVLLDLIFIIFESANSALAFAALVDSKGSCVVGQNGKNINICNRVKALCGILMLALIAWSLTFSVSIFRLVERVGGREDSD